MRITRYQDIREGDTIWTSNGPQIIGTVNQYVAWAGVTVVRPDGSEWSMQIHESSMFRFHVTREAFWTCPACNGHRCVIQGFPLGGPTNPRGIDMGTRRVCRSCDHSYLLPAGQIDPNVTVPTEEDVK